NILLLIAGEGEVREHERPLYLPSVLAAMDPSHRRHPDAAIRRLVLEIITLCARHKPSRLYLKSIAVYPILRELHKYEKNEHQQQQPQGSKELDEIIYDIVPYFILDEEKENN